MVVIAEVISGPYPQQGQENRSSGDFQLAANDRSPISVACPPNIRFNIMQDLRFRHDPIIVEGVMNGSQLNGDLFDTGENYYIANPQGATGDFQVTLSQN